MPLPSGITIREAQIHEQGHLVLAVHIPVVGSRGYQRQVLVPLKEWQAMAGHADLEQWLTDHFPPPPGWVAGMVEPVLPDPPPILLPASAPACPCWWCALSRWLQRP